MNVLGQAMVMPILAGLQVALNQVMAPCFFSEAFECKYDGIGTGFILIGVGLTTLYGPGSPYGSNARPADPDTFLAYKADIEAKWISTPWAVFEFTVIFAFIFCLMKKNDEGLRHITRLWMHGFIAGTLMGQQQCIVKGFGGVSAQFARDPVITLSHWPLYFYLPFMILMAVAATYHINVGLMNFGALEFVPVQVMCMMVLGTLTGLFFDQEYNILKTVGWIVFTFGIVVIGVGLKVLSMKPGPEDDSNYGCLFLS